MPTDQVCVSKCVICTMLRTFLAPRLRASLLHINQILPWAISVCAWHQALPHSSLTFPQSAMSWVSQMLLHSNDPFHCFPCALPSLSHNPQLHNAIIRSEVCSGWLLLKARPGLVRHHFILGSSQLKAKQNKKALSFTLKFI